ncbi:MAG: hypothetical protein RBT36_00640 [Desulfobulbus sp.]|jgi:hypothetical protein|nr:hypothetical protein [Desulfobulbus sp.]
MVEPAPNLIAKRVSLYEATAILFIIFVIWIDEILDIPYLLLGGPATPINWRESLFESVIILMIGAVIIRHTYRLLVRVSHLESTLPVCASCGKIRADPEFWQGVEQFVAARSKNEGGHHVCPDCLHKYYPELERQENDTTGSK